MRGLERFAAHDAGRPGLRQLLRGRGERSEAALLAALRDGDQAAFGVLIDMYGSLLMRVAMMYVSSRAVAEEVVQETWLGVLRGIDGFEGRSSLKTWIFRILVNTAKTRGEREGRSIPFSSAVQARPDEPSVEPDRFFPAGHPSAGNWSLGPTAWETPEERLLAGESRDVILRTIESLPPAQREVITLRDVQGWTSNEVCNALEITETNQRVLLHRARTKVRAALERYYGATEPTVRGDTEA
jgi:RNA polymerase sigma-70 factor (ECF subfamily)